MTEVIKDADHWLAIVNGRRFGRFSSKEAAERFIDAFVYGEFVTPTLAEAIVELRRAQAYAKHSVEFAANDHMREIMKRSAALTEQHWRDEIMRVADDEAKKTKN